MTFLEGIILITGALACFKFGTWFESVRAEMEADHRDGWNDPADVDPTTNDELTALAKAYELKRKAFQMHQARNMFGLTAEAETKASIAYHQAEADMLEAHRALEGAKHKPGDAT